MTAMETERRANPHPIPGWVAGALFPDAVGVVHDVAITSGDLFDIASLRCADSTESHDIDIRAGLHIRIEPVQNTCDAGIDVRLRGFAVGLGPEAVAPSDVNLVGDVNDRLSVRFGEMEYRSNGAATMASKHDTTADPALRISTKGKALKALLPRQGLYLCIVPPGTTAITIASRVAVAPDKRVPDGYFGPRGVCVTRIVLRDGDDWHDIPVDHPGLSQGWGPAERDGMALFRWTDGDAVLPLHDIPRATILELEIGMEIRYRMAPSTQ